MMMDLCAAEALWSTLLLISCKKNYSKGNGVPYAFVRQISGIGIKGVLRNDFREGQKSEKKKQVGFQEGGQNPIFCPQNPIFSKKLLFLNESVHQ